VLVSDESVVRLTHACVEYDGTHVLEDVELDVTAGQFVALLGPNGSGKTTLVRAALGLEPLSHGTASLFGTPLSRFHDWSRIALVPQRLPAAANVPVSVWETVLSGSISPRGRYRPFTREQRRAAQQALETVSLWDRRHDRLDTLSGGQQRRVLIARALSTSADLFVLDEPTAGVDGANQRRVAEVLTGLAALGRTVVLVAHELGPLEPLVTRVVVLGRGRDGSILFDGPPPAPDHLHDPVHHHSHDVEPPPGPAFLEG
jgi:zinc transport system ATP-binding protein